MLVTPHLYGQFSRSYTSPENAYWSSLPPLTERYVRKMLLIHQSGSVRIGEVVRYTVSYTPARDRVRPLPRNLHVRIRNNCAIALRAAYLHGPYTLYVACYPATFNSNAKHDSETYGEPQFEPMLKAGGSWTATLKVPESLRQACEETASNREAPESCSWIIECTSQVLFSVSANVHYEVIVGRDARSVETGFAGLTGTINSTPGRLIDHQQSANKPGEHVGLMKGVFSNAITVLVEDTACLWNKPQLPGLKHSGFHEYKPGKGVQRGNPTDAEDAEDIEGHSHTKAAKKRNVHLVIITHGLHSNLGADMLYMKESIDAAAKQARLDARERRKVNLSRIPSNPIHDYDSNSPPPPEERNAKKEATSTAPLSGGQDDVEPEDDEEEVIVRGFSGNAVRTERGIQYLGKRLAKYVLGMTYPDQPFLPVKKSFKKTLSRTFTRDEHESHNHSSVKQGPEVPDVDRSYRITSISFIGHSLGGLTQTYAIAYIHKHSPEFFKLIQPVNFIGLASPFLGLSNENPLYVKFALDFGLVGRTGQDLGLTWRPPTLARSGWAGVIAGIGNDKQRAPKKVDPGTKPLLRLLPSGPAHQALKVFRNRTVYSNVVNDGIVPLRTSCLLFLDWRGLGRVEKARRENGLIGTMAGWGWAELTGTNQTEHRNQWPWQKHGHGSDDEFDAVPEVQDGMSDVQEGGEVPSGLSDVREGEEVLKAMSDVQEGKEVPQPADDETRADNATTRQNMAKKVDREGEERSMRGASPGRREPESPMAGFMSFFGRRKEHSPEPKSKPSKMIRRAQTLMLGSDDDAPERGDRPADPADSTGDSFAPPKTSVFEAAGDLINPPLPPTAFLVDPQSRPRAIFHDRIYHPEDIPPPPMKRRPTFMRRKSSKLAEPGSPPSRAGSDNSMDGSMQVEEKIARAYHRDLSWRKVLVRLEPDAHNNMVVRRMFANAYGWPVVKHLVDTHFADTKAALTADRKEENVERARPMTEPATAEGDEVNEQRKRATGDEDDERELMYREAHDELQELKETNDAVGSLSSSVSKIQRQDSVTSSAWTDRFFEEEEDSDDGEDTPRSAKAGTSANQVDDFLFGKPQHEGESSQLVMPVGKAEDHESPSVSGVASP